MSDDLKTGTYAAMQKRLATLEAELSTLRQRLAAVEAAAVDCVRLMEQRRPEAPTAPCYRAEWDDAITELKAALENRE